MFDVIDGVDDVGDIIGDDVDDDDSDDIVDVGECNDDMDVKDDTIGDIEVDVDGDINCIDGKKDDKDNDDEGCAT